MTENDVREKWDITLNDGTLLHMNQEYYRWSNFMTEPQNPKSHNMVNI